MKSRRPLAISNAPDAGRYQLHPDILTRIWLERLRQKQLFRDGKISFDCASPVVSDDRKLRVVMEELGEVAERIDDNERLQKPGDGKLAAEHIMEELIQVGAVVFAWLESLEEKLNENTPRT